MSFTSQELLKSSLSDNSFLTNSDMPAGLEEAIKEVDQTIRAYTGREIPDDATDANEMIRSIANNLVIWKTAGFQTDLSEQQYKRLKTNYKDAMAKLQMIQDGELTVDHTNDEDEDITPNVPQIRGTNRIDEML